MEEPYIRRIRSRAQYAAGTGEEMMTYVVQLPTEWAEAMLRDGCTHVQADAKFGRLELTPLREEEVTEYRDQRRKQRNREAARRRYEGRV